MSPKKASKKKTVKSSPKEDKAKTLEITITSEIRRALELIRLPNETDEIAIARALHESFEFSLIRNVIVQIDERLEGIISSKVEEEIAEAEEAREEILVPDAPIHNEEVSVLPVDAVDDVDDAITEEIESKTLKSEEPDRPPAVTPEPPEISETPKQTPPEPAVSTKPPETPSKVEAQEPKPEVGMMKKNLEKKWIHSGDGV